MSLPTPKVEIGFDIVSANANLFTLDDPVKGLLDNISYPLSGSIYYDVTDMAKAITVRRGKNRQLDQYDPGLANVVFNNNDRVFDPEFTGSPYYGQIIPKRSVRISSGGEFIFHGSIDDWNLDYVPFGISEASIACSDGFSDLQRRTLSAGTATPQTTGQRINTVLSSADVNWPTTDRDIDTGQTDLGADVVAKGTLAIDYLRKVTESEPGQFFMSRENKLTFIGRYPRTGGNVLTFTDSGEGITYNNIKVVYGSELLYNEISLSNVNNVTATATDATSVAQYGIQNYTSTGLLTSSPTDLANIAVLTANKYSSPEYRFDSLELILDKFDEATQSSLLAMEIGDAVQITFTPNQIPPSITKYAEVIRIGHDITPNGHVMSLGFSTIDRGFWTLSNEVFGRLSAGNTLGF
jgi:hypothetical protein